MDRRLRQALIAPLRAVGLLPAAFRWYERLSARRAAGASDARTDDGLALPPPLLRYRVAGSTDSAWFIECGAAVFGLIEQQLAERGVKLSDLGDVLDFGCGCGRVLRHWRIVTGPRIHGSDYSAELVAWCDANLRFAQVSVNSGDPPLAHVESTFDLVYAISVFTHLSVERQTRWLDELWRVLKPGGYLLLTLHAASFRDQLDERERAAFDAGELVVRYREASGTNLCGVYHPDAFVRGAWTRAFEVCALVPAGTRANVLQDVYLLRKI